MSEELQQKIGYDILASMPGGGGEHGDGDTVILHFSEMSAETLWKMIFKISERYHWGKRYHWMPVNKKNKTIQA
jgi:hypothetical protein